MKSFWYCVYLFSLFFLITPLSQAADTTPTTTGTAIGQTINAAITAALPGVSAIENIIAALFKKPTGTTVAPTATTKVSAQDVTNAVNTATKTLQTNAQTRLNALQIAVQEIATANALAITAQTASATLPSTAFLNIPGGMDAFKTQWGVAKQNLNKVTAFDASKLGKISSESVVAAWTTLNNNYNQWISDVDTNIVNPATATPTSLAIGLQSYTKLSMSVQAIAMLPSVELSLLSNQLNSLVKTPTTPGTGTPSVTNEAPTIATPSNSLEMFIRRSMNQ